MALSEETEEIAEGEQRRRNTGITLKARRQAMAEVQFWWKEIHSLRSDRSRMLGLTATGIAINIDNREQKLLVANGNSGNAPVQLPEKIYIGFDPDRDWPDPPTPQGRPSETITAAREEAVEGEYEDAATDSG